MTSRLLIIPARGGSKRIKNKNIKLFFRKPIIYYPIRNAIKSKLFKHIHVSTDSLKIKKISHKAGAKVDFLRPKKLAKNNTPIIDVVNYVYNEFLKKK